MKSEETIYDAPKQQTENVASTSSNQDEPQVKVVSKKPWAQAAAGAGAGILLGSAATLLMGSAPAPETLESGFIDSEGDSSSHAQWTDGEVEIASHPTDDMSFDQAFAAARAEVGSGGAFEWHGNIYSTFTAEEWDAMSPAERDEYGNHFNWSSGSDYHDSTQHVAVDDPVVAEPVNPEQPHPVSHDPEPVPVVNDDDVQVLGGTSDDDVQVLGVIHDDETGMNFGGATIEGQNVIFVDVNTDDVMDVAISDFDHNGEITDDEYVDISEANITTDDLGGYVEGAEPGLAETQVDTGEFTPTDDPTLSQADIDYTNDADVSDYIYDA